jgi:hypothetical protein
MKSGTKELRSSFLKSWQKLGRSETNTLFILGKSTPINRATLMLRFKLFATISYISFEDGGYDIAQLNAQRALDMIDMPLSGFEKKLSRTPFDGYEDTIKRLKRIINYRAALAT